MEERDPPQMKVYQDLKPYHMAYNNAQNRLRPTCTNKCIHIQYSVNSSPTYKYYSIINDMQGPGWTDCQVNRLQREVFTDEASKS